MMFGCRELKNSDHYHIRHSKDMKMSLRRLVVMCGNAQKVYIVSVED